MVGFDDDVAVRELDINRVPSSDHEEEEEESMELEDEENSIHNGVSTSAPPRKKLRLTKDQSRLLEDSFRQHHTLNPVILINLLHFFSLIKSDSLIY